MPHFQYAPSGHRNFLTALVFSCCLLTWIPDASILWAQPLSRPAQEAAPIGFSADQLLAFADQLMREGEFFRAITEYRRFLFSFPQDSRRAMIHFRIGIALYRGQQYEDALRTFREVVQQYPETTYAEQAQLWQGESFMKLSRYEDAQQVYTEILQQARRSDVSEQAQYQRGWALLYQRQWQEAAKQFQRLTPESSLYQASQQLAEESHNGARLPQKSPPLAGALSGLLPGSGQLYNGRLGDALLAFFLNGLFVVGIVEAVHHDELAIAGALSFFEAGWYAGNIYSAVNGAHKYNRRQTEVFIRNLETRFRFPPPEAQKGIGVRFSLGF